MTAGLLTRQEADELHRRLDSLAFNMTVAGQQGMTHKAAAAYWLFHLRTRKLYRLPYASQEEQELASKWCILGERAGLIRQSENTVAFLEVSLQELFCVHFCSSRPLDRLLLRLAARPSFPEVWRLWARQDATVLERLIKLLSAPGHAARVRAARVLGYLADPRATDALIARLNDPTWAVRLIAAEALGRISDPRAIEPIIRLLPGANDTARSALVRSLVRFGQPTVEAMITLLDLPTYEDRTIIRPAISALETLRDPRAREPLLNHLSRWDYLTARMAMHAAGRLPLI